MCKVGKIQTHSCYTTMIDSYSIHIKCKFLYYLFMIRILFFMEFSNKTWIAIAEQQFADG